jgi:hypothetical protein
MKLTEQQKQIMAAMDWAANCKNGSMRIEVDNHRVNCYISRYDGTDHAFLPLKGNEGTDFDAMLDAKLKEDEFAEYVKLKAKFSPDELL